MINYPRRGGVLIVLDLNQLGRLAGEVIQLIGKLEGRGVGFGAPNVSSDTMTPMGRTFLHIQAAFAEVERNVIQQRVKEGIAAPPPVPAVARLAGRA